MNTKMTISQDSWFDPFSAKRQPPPPAQSVAGSGAAGAWYPAVALIDPGDDPNDDPDAQARA